MYFVWTLFFFFFKQKTAYEMRISDWSSDVCSSDLINETAVLAAATSRTVHDIGGATNNAAEQMGGIDKAFAEVADHIHLLERTVKMFIGQVSDERPADEASARI